MATEHATAVADAGGLIGAWPCGFTSSSMDDFGTEIIRLTEAAGPVTSPSAPIWTATTSPS